MPHIGLVPLTQLTDTDENRSDNSDGENVFHYFSLTLGDGGNSSRTGDPGTGEEPVRQEMETTSEPFPVEAVEILRGVGLGGLEPPTSSLSAKRSNRLSYGPVTLNSLPQADQRPFAGVTPVPTA